MTERSIERTQNVVFHDIYTALKKNHDEIEHIRQARESFTELIKKTTSELASLRAEFLHSVEKIAEKTAFKASRLLNEQFSQTNRDAKKLTLLYQEAARQFTFKRWIWHFTILLTIGIIVLTAIIRFLPSLDEIQNRRAERDALNAEIAETKARIAELEQSHLKQSLCNGKACIHLNEKKSRLFGYSDPGGTWWIRYRNKH